MDELVTFVLTKQHIKLAKELRFRTVIYDPDDFGADGELRPGIDAKRPFGNSDLIGDVLRIAYGRDSGEDYSEEEIRKAKQLIVELPMALNIILQKQTFEPGVYAGKKGVAYYQYKGLSNYLTLEPALKEIDEAFPDDKEYPSGETRHPYWKEQIRICARHLPGDDPWEQMYAEFNISQMRASWRQMCGEAGYDSSTMQELSGMEEYYTFLERCINYHRPLLCNGRGL